MLAIFWHCIGLTIFVHFVQLLVLKLHSNIITKKSFKMKTLLKGTLATAVLALTNLAVFAGTNNSTDNSSNGAAVVGFFAVLVAAIVIPALGHKAHH